MPGIELEDVMAGISVCRNQELANVFYRLRLIEAYGTGIGKIMKAYEDQQEKPSIETTKNVFKIVLPNVNAKYEIENRTAAEKEQKILHAISKGKKLSDEEKKILSYTRTHGSITKNDAIELLKVSASTATRVIRKMVKGRLLKQNGKARNTHYTIVE